jgi:beta-lactamase class A
MASPPHQPTMQHTSFTPSSPVPPPAAEALNTLHLRLDTLERTSGALSLAVAVYDTETSTNFRRHADRWFHAASTIKVAILLGVYASIYHGWLLPHSRLHVRNRFASSVDGAPFRVGADRDANSEVHDAIGKMMRISDLALHMIATSSNLATNLLLDLVGLDTVQRALDELGIDGIDIRRGVEDERAFERGINNRVTADGLVQLLRLIAEERAYTPELSREMLEILHAQEFRNGIPARLPKAVRVAHKTGEISTIAHDAGVVYPPNRKPYVLAVLTEWSSDGSGRKATIAEVSQAVYELLTTTSASKQAASNG